MVSMRKKREIKGGEERNKVTKIKREEKVYIIAIKPQCEQVTSDINFDLN